MVQSYKKGLNNPVKKFNLTLKMILLICLLIGGIFVMFGLFLRSFITETIEDQVGKRALSVAESVANMPEVKEAFQKEDPASVIQDIVSPIRKQTGAEFIVVGNRKGIRYSHPEPDRLRKRMVGGDNEQALSHGESYISKRVGSLGLSMRGKVPIYDDNHAVIGLVSVGFLNTDIQGIIKRQSKSLWFTMFGIVLLGVTGAIFIAYYIKKLLFHMEPEEISHMLAQKEAILHSTHEGILAVDHLGMITMMNTAAQRILSKQGEKDYTGRSIREIWPHTNLFAVLKNGESHYNREMVLGGSIVLVNHLPIHRGGMIAGVVSTFQKKTDIAHITQELSQVKQYASAQRAQTHEFSNKLYIILGLLELEKDQEAIEFIRKEMNIQQAWSHLLFAYIADPTMQGLLQGKFNQASELGIRMMMQPESQLTYRLSAKKSEALLTGIGNLLENAVEAVKHHEGTKREISIFITDIGEDVIAEIDDSGPGIDQKAAAHIFTQGFSTKSDARRGTGLALTKHVLENVNGALMLEESDLGGACFVLVIPKDGGKTDDGNNSGPDCGG